MFGIERSQNVELHFQGGYIRCTYNVPTAEEMQSLVSGIAAGKQNDCDIFKQFVTKIESSDPDVDGKFPSDLVKMPGSWTIVQRTSQAVIKSSWLSEDEKNG